MLSLILDQRRSGGESTGAQRLAAALRADDFGVLPEPAVTAGDELEVVIGPGALPRVLRRTVDDEAEWWVGLGLGRLRLPPQGGANLTGGPGMLAARRAIGAAKGDPEGVAVIAAGGLDAAALRGVVAAYLRLLRGRSPQQRRTLAAWDGGRPQARVAAEVGISQQAVSRQLRRAGATLEPDLARAVVVVAEAVAAPTSSGHA